MCVIVRQDYSVSLLPGHESQGGCVCQMVKLQENRAVRGLDLCELHEGG